MILLVIGIMLVVWVCCSVLCYVLGIALIIMGIMIAKKEKPRMFLKLKSKKVFLVLYIIVGVIMIAVSFIMMLPVLKGFEEDNFLGLYDVLLKCFAIMFFFMTFGLFAICAFVATVSFWVKGIRTARELKLIDDVDTYNKKIKLSFLLIFLGTAGIGVSIFASWAFIRALNILNNSVIG